MASLINSARRVIRATGLPRRVREELGRSAFLYRDLQPSVQKKKKLQGRNKNSREEDYKFKPELEEPQPADVQLRRWKFLLSDHMLICYWAVKRMPSCYCRCFGWRINRLVLFNWHSIIKFPGFFLLHLPIEFDLTLVRGTWYSQISFNPIKAKSKNMNFIWNCLYSTKSSRFLSP